MSNTYHYISFFTWVSIYISISSWTAHFWKSSEPLPYQDTCETNIKAIIYQIVLSVFSMFFLHLISQTAEIRQFCLVDNVGYTVADLAFGSFKRNGDEVLLLFKTPLSFSIRFGVQKRPYAIFSKWYFANLSFFLLSLLLLLRLLFPPTRCVQVKIKTLKDFEFNGKARTFE